MNQSKGEIGLGSIYGGAGRIGIAAGDWIGFGKK